MSSSRKIDSRVNEIGEKRNGLFGLTRNISCNIECETRFTHTRSGGKNDKVGTVKSRNHSVKVAYARWDRFHTVVGFAVECVKSVKSL